MKKTKDEEAEAEEQKTTKRKDNNESCPTIVVSEWKIYMMRKDLKPVKRKTI